MSGNTPDSTASLLAACAAAPASSCAWSDLVDRLAPCVRRGVLGALARANEPRAPELIEDLVQEVWCRLLDRGHEVLTAFRGIDDRAAAAYVRRIAANVAIDRLRAEGARKRRPRRLLPLEAMEADAAPADRSRCPERRLLARERFGEQIELWRRLLGPRLKRTGLRIAIWAWVEGLSSAEIALRLGSGWPANRIDAVLFRLRRRLTARGEAAPRRLRERLPRGARADG